MSLLLTKLANLSLGSMRLGDLWKARTSRQTLCLYASHVFVLIVGMLISVLYTRFLEPADYGLYALSFAVVDFVVLFMNFGVFSSGARLLANSQDDEKTQGELLGALVLLAALLALGSALIVLGFSFYAPRLLKAPIDGVLRPFCILFGLLVSNALVEAVCRGRNRIVSLAFFQAGSKTLCLCLASLVILFGRLTLERAVFFSLCSVLVTAVIVICSCRPRFSGQALALRMIWQDVRTYGFKVYTGDIAGTASYRTDSLLISYFHSATLVGFYRLAVLLTSPLRFFSRSLATTLFLRFARDDSIAKNVLMVNLSVLLSGALALILAGRFIVAILFGPAYSHVAELIFPMAVAGVFGGMASPYNMYLGAKGQGGALRTAALVLTATNITLNVLLIPAYGAVGAAYASAVALLVNLVVHLHYYRRAVHATSEPPRTGFAKRGPRR